MKLSDQLDSGRRYVIFASECFLLHFALPENEKKFMRVVLTQVSG